MSGEVGIDYMLNVSNGKILIEDSDIKSHTHARARAHTHTYLVLPYFMSLAVRSFSGFLLH